jgi:diacylglycerol kinase family enzyme
MTDPIPAFVNESAGSAEAMVAALRAVGGFEVRPTDPAGLADSLRAAVADGARRVAVAGGDGTIACAASVLAGTPVQLAVLPGGTLNHFARDAGIPDEPDAAARLARDGAPTTADVAYVNGRLFHGTSSVGAYVVFVRTRERLERWCGYRIASVLAALRMFLGLRTFWVELETAGVSRRYRTPMVFIGVGEREPGAPKFGKRVEHGKRGLHVMVVQGRTRARMLAMALAAATRGRRWLRRSTMVDSFIVDHLRIEFARPVGTVSLDGELVRMQSPLEYQLARDALTVVAAGGPATKAKHEGERGMATEE